MDAVIAYIAILTLLASVVGTFTGFGISTIMMPVLLIFLPLPQTLLLVGIIHWFGDVWKMLFFRHGIRWKLLVGFGIPGVIASFIGASLSLTIPHDLLSRALGIFLVVYVAYLYLHPAFRLGQSMPVAAAGGASSGFFAGIFGIGGEIRTVFLSAFNLEKAVYLATAGAIALVIDSSRLITYMAGGTILPQPLLYGLMAFIPASLVGAVLGREVVNKIPQERFRVAISVFILLLGAKLALLP
jgi:uncharacterized protein